MVMVMTMLICFVLVEQICYVAAAFIAAVDYCCCCCRASMGLATADTYTTRCCEQVRHAAAVQYRT